jgi:hypothetical protein
MLGRTCDLNSKLWLDPLQSAAVEDRENIPSVSINVR